MIFWSTSEPVRVGSDTAAGRAARWAADPPFRRHCHAAWTPCWGCLGSQKARVAGLQVEAGPPGSGAAARADGDLLIVSRRADGGHDAARGGAGGAGGGHQQGAGPGPAARGGGGRRGSPGWRVELVVPGVLQALQAFVEDMERTHLRPLRKESYLCAARCCDTAPNHAALVDWCVSRRSSLLIQADPCVTQL